MAVPEPHRTSEQGSRSALILTGTVRLLREATALTGP